VIALYVERTLMLNGSFIVCSSRLIPFTIVEANDAKSPFLIMKLLGYFASSCSHFLVLFYLSLNLKKRLAQ